MRSVFCSPRRRSLRRCLPRPIPCPGSSFQGADGNQVDSGPLIDWQEMVSTARFLHRPDPNEQNTLFANSKENEPGSWDLTTEAGGVSPGKSNILDAWSATDVQGGEAFLYLAFTRDSAQGTTYLAFELNHDSGLWNNGRATIPCAARGDILVSYEAQGNAVSVIVQRWVTSQTDPSTGCATTGRLDDFTDLTPNVEAQGAVNSSSTLALLPGFYRTAIPLHRFRGSGAEPHAHHLNGNGRRDTGEPGLPRWLIWADYDDDGVHDAAVNGGRVPQIRITRLKVTGGLPVPRWKMTRTANR